MIGYLKYDILIAFQEIGTEREEKSMNIVGIIATMAILASMVFGGVLKNHEANR